MVSIRNIRKFFYEHPEYADQKEKALAIADRLRGEGIILMGSAAQQAMGSLAEEFFMEVTTNEEHIQIGLQDIAFDSSLRDENERH